MCCDCACADQPQPTLFGASLHDLTRYNGLELCVRGDGRAYIVNIRTDGYQPDDVFQAYLYTRGGPVWQTVHVRAGVAAARSDGAQIPFSEFLLTNMGFVQNEQTLLHSGQIVNFALLLADRVPGPFRCRARCPLPCSFAQARRQTHHCDPHGQGAQQHGRGGVMCACSAGLPAPELEEGLQRRIVDGLVVDAGVDLPRGEAGVRRMGPRLAQHLGVLELGVQRLDIPLHSWQAHDAADAGRQ